VAAGGVSGSSHAAVPSVDSVDDRVRGEFLKQPAGAAPADERGVLVSGRDTYASCARRGDWWCWGWSAAAVVIEESAGGKAQRDKRGCDCDLRISGGARWRAGVEEIM
jgi:hypothetical protein